MKKSETGKLGEDKACEYLENKGYSILTRNYRKKFGEIDIIGKSADGILIFFEVKTLRSRNLSPEDNFTTQKGNKVKKTCEFFAAKYPKLIDDEKGWRIDLVAIEISDDGKTMIRHYENV